MDWLGDFPEDFAAVTCMFTTHQSTGAPVAPLSAFEAADFAIFKNGSATEKTSTNGLTITSAFNGTTGLHCLVIDTSNDTDDSGFWTAGAVYTVVLTPDETVDGVAVVKVIGQFGIELAGALRPATAGRKLVVDAAGLADANAVKLGPSGSGTAQTARDIGASVVAASVSTGGITSGSFAAGAIDNAAIATDAIGAAELAASAVTEIQSGLATASALSSIDGKIDIIDDVVDAIQAKTGNLPSDPADQSLIIAATNSLASSLGTIEGKVDTVDTVVDAVKLRTDNLPASPAATGDAMTLTGAYDAAKTAASQSSVDDLPTNAEMATALAGADDAVLAAIAALPTTSTVMQANIKKINDVDVTGNGAGTPWGPA